MRERSAATSAQPLAPSYEARGCSARILYSSLALLRLCSYAFALWLYCSSEPRAGGMAGCQKDPPTLSTASSYLGEHGLIRSSVCIAACLLHVIVMRPVLSFIYCEMLQPPPLPRTFSLALGVWCLLEIVQVVTAHSTEHYIIAHVYFAALILAVILFFHGTLASKGLWGQGVFAALPLAVVFFAAMVGLCVYMLVVIMILHGSIGSWVLVEYAAALLLIGMHVAIGLALPCGFFLYVRSPWEGLLMGDRSRSCSSKPDPKGDA